MTQPIDPALFVATNFENPETYTLRAAVEWYKGLIHLSAALGVPTTLETNLMNDRWGVLCKGIASREGIPAGWVSYMLSELAQTEIRLLETATEEAQAATAYRP